MKSYRTHRVDDRGTIRGAQVIEAASPHIAVLLARALAVSEIIELWDSMQLIATAPPTSGRTSHQSNLRTKPVAFRGERPAPEILQSAAIPAN